MLRHRLRAPCLAKHVPDAQSPLAEPSHSCWARVTAAAARLAAGGGGGGGQARLATAHPTPRHLAAAPLAAALSGVQPAVERFWGGGGSRPTRAATEGLAASTKRLPRGGRVIADPREGRRDADPAGARKTAPPQGQEAALGAVSAPGGQSQAAWQAHSTIGGMFVAAPRQPSWRGVRARMLACWSWVPMRSCEWVTRQQSGQQRGEGACARVRCPCAGEQGREAPLVSWLWSAACAAREAVPKNTGRAKECRRQCGGLYAARDAAVAGTRAGARCCARLDGGRRDSCVHRALRAGRPRAEQQVSGHHGGERGVDESGVGCGVSAGGGRAQHQQLRQAAAEGCE